MKLEIDLDDDVVNEAVRRAVWYFLSIHEGAHGVLIAHLRDMALARVTEALDRIDLDTAVALEVDRTLKAAVENSVRKALRDQTDCKVATAIQAIGERRCWCSRLSDWLGSVAR